MKAIRLASATRQSHGAARTFPCKATLLAFALGVATTLVTTSQALAQAAQPTIEGVWIVRRHGADCASGQVFPGPGFPAYMTFTRDGLVLSYSVGPGSTPANGGAEFGVWKRESGAANYSFHVNGPGYDADGNFSGSGDISASATVTDGGSGLQYKSVIKFLDPSGATLFQICGAATGTRFQ